MKYTKSVDGIDRCTVHLQMRFSRKEYETLSDQAAQLSFASVQEMLSDILLDEERLRESIIARRDLIV